MTHQSLISIFLPNLHGGGAERVMLDLAGAFATSGYRVEFVLMRDTGDFLREASAHFSIVSLDAARIRQVPMAFQKYLRGRRPDVVIANMWPLTTAAVLGKLLSQSSCRLLLVDHAILTQQCAARGWKMQLLLYTTVRWSYRFADRVVAVSRGIACDVSRLACAA